MADLSDYIDSIFGTSVERGFDMNIYLREFGESPSELDPYDDSHLHAEEVSDAEYWANYGP